MEDMARLALVEQNVRDADTFSKILYELLLQINHILENPHDVDTRTIKGEGLKKFFQYEALIDYLKSIGFKPVDNEYIYPKEETLNNLRLARAAVERKIHFCCGSLKKIEQNIQSLHKIPKAKDNLLPVKGLPTRNPLLKKMEVMFNEVLQYEDEELQAYAREQIPIVTLQLMALDEMRDHQKKIKSGEIREPDMPFDMALLKMLLSWFKHRFFSWVDAPACDQCGGATRHYRNSTFTNETETCNLEIYRCMQCGYLTEFPRYNVARTLLARRRGRCGEWANCFTLIARAMGYDARLVYSTSDHVWCEIWDYESSQWLHCDPCECLLDAPLTYSVGWGKRLQYVLAFSRDDLQDVTWRYTQQHTQVLKSRTSCSESELLECIMWLRSQRQLGVSEARRKYLAKRNVQELVSMLVERTPMDSELRGRISGSAAWRHQRGEMGTKSHVFRFRTPGVCTVKYFVVPDRYDIENGEENGISTWSAGAHTQQQMFRKIETDWKMVYLAREEGAKTGLLSWKLEAGAGCSFTSLSIRAHTAVYEDGRVHWTVQLDEHEPTPIDPTEPVELSGRFLAALVTARVCGGRGHTAWQHAQLFRANLTDQQHQMHIQANLQLD